MPIVIPAAASSSSAAQVVPTSAVYDYLQDAQGNALANRTIKIVLNTAQANSITPQVSLQALQILVTTDANGFWQASLVPNGNINPANTLYDVVTPIYSYQITVGPSGPYQSTSVGTIVNSPASLAPATSSIIGPLTVAGLLTASAGLSVTGGATVDTLTLGSGGLSMTGPLTLTAPASRIVPGATSFAVRDTGNANDNLLVTNAGVVTARAGLVVTAGGLTATGNSTITGTLSGLTGLTVASGGITVTGASTITGTLGGITTLTATTLAGTLSTAAQASVTSLGNLTGLQLLSTNVGAGTLGYAQVVADQGAIVGAFVDLTSLTVTFTAVTGRRYKATAYCAFQSTVANDYANLLIGDGVTTYANAFWDLGVVGSQVQNTIVAVVTGLSAGSKTWKLTAQRGVGTGTLTLKAAATNPAFILIEDIGT